MRCYYRYYFTLLTLIRIVIVVGGDTLFYCTVLWWWLCVFVLLLMIIVIIVIVVIVIVIYLTCCCYCYNIVIVLWLLLFSCYCYCVTFVIVIPCVYCCCYCYCDIVVVVVLLTLFTLLERCVPVGLVVVVIVIVIVVVVVLIVVVILDCYSVIIAAMLLLLLMHCCYYRRLLLLYLIPLFVALTRLHDVSGGTTTVIDVVFILMMPRFCCSVAPLEAVRYCCATFMLFDRLWTMLRLPCCCYLLVMIPVFHSLPVTWWRRHFYILQLFWYHYSMIHLPSIVWRPTCLLFIIFCDDCNDSVSVTYISLGCCSDDDPTIVLLPLPTFRLCSILIVLIPSWSLTLFCCYSGWRYILRRYLLADTVFTLPLPRISTLFNYLPMIIHDDFVIGLTL